jgi:heat shock protein HtpX
VESTFPVEYPLTSIIPVLILAAILALVPGLYAWWTGRALLARVDDPAFPELLFAQAQRRTHVAVAAVVLSTFVTGPHWVWALPLFAVALLAGSFPFRRALYGETWGVGAYVGHSLLAFVGAAGFWLSLALAPVLVLALVDGWTPGSSPFEGAAIVGAIVAGGLVAWEVAYPLLWLGLHRATRVDRHDLTRHFDDIIRRSKVAKQPPHVFRYGFRGAYVMNAVALPSARQPRVAFGDSLLELLAPDEIVAVFAHEVSHLEHYDRRRVTRLRLITYLLIAAGTALPAIMFATAPTFLWLAKLAWPVVVMAVVALRASKSQAHETESDLRAGELTGDPEAMIRALTKLHHYSRMPRRWPYDFERAASHPSLARRIQALRTQGAANAAAPAAAPTGPSAPTILRSTVPGAYVALDETRAYWIEGVPSGVAVQTVGELREHATSYRAVAYSDLTELRVAVVRAGGRTLLARDRAGKTWSVPIRVEDVASAQIALDVLDVRLGNHETEDWRTKARVAATLLAVALVGTLDFGWTWLPLVVTLVKPSAASVAAMGSMAIARLLLTALAGTLSTSVLGVTWPAVWLSVALTLAVATWSCRIAWRWTRGENRPIKRPLAIVALATIMVVLLGTIAITTQVGRPVVGSPMASLEPMAAISLLLLGVGAGFLTYKDSLRRRSGIALCLVALALGGIGAEGSGLLTRGADIAWTSGQADVTEKVSLGGYGYRLQLAPSGRRFAVQSASRHSIRDDEDERMSTLWRFTVGSANGPRRTTEGFDLAFLDDERVVVLRPTAGSGDSLDLSIEAVAGRDATAAWKLTIPAYYAPTLTLDRRTETWRVIGYDVHGGNSVVISRGRIGSDSIGIARLPRALVNGRSLHIYRNGSSLVTSMNGSFGKVHMLLAVLGANPFKWDVWHLSDGRHRKVATLPGFPECGPIAEGDEAVLCVVRGRSGLTLWRIPTPTGDVIESLGALPSDIERWDIGANGQIVSASREGSMLAVVDASTGRGTRITLGNVRQQGTPVQSYSYTADVATAAGIVATLVVRDQKSEVTFYRLK